MENAVRLNGIAFGPHDFDGIAKEIRNQLFVGAVPAGPDTAKGVGVTSVLDGEIAELDTPAPEFGKDRVAIPFRCGFGHITDSLQEAGGSRPAFCRWFCNICGTPKRAAQIGINTLVAIRNNFSVDFGI